MNYRNKNSQEIENSIYDLEKKIHNLFELALITGSEIEPRTQ